MNAGDLKQFADDLRRHAGITAEVHIDPDAEGLHVLRINGVDFYFYADGSGYDGWGKQAGGRAQV